MQWTQYQQRYLADRSSQKAVVKSRRIGFSEVVCFERALRALGLELYPGRPPKVVQPVSQNVVSAGYDQAKDLLKRIAFHIDALSVTFNGAKLIKSQAASLIELANGAKLRAYSSNPRTMRGFEGDVLLDEFSAVRDQDGVWAAIAPMAKANLRNRDGYQIVVVGTPLGDANRFFEVIRGKYSESFSQHEVSIHEAAADGFPITTTVNGLSVPGTIDDLRAEIGDPEIFAQEFECSFIAANSRYIPAEIYDAACYDEEELPEDFNALGKINEYGGVDVARVRDRTAFSKLGKYGDTAWHLFTDVLQNKPWEEQEDWVDQRIKGCLGVAVDASAIGSQFAERMSNRWAGVIDQIVFTNQNKEALATGLKLALSTGKLRPKSDDIELRREVLSMRREFTETGLIRYATPREGGGHGDRAWSLALALSAAGGASMSDGIPSILTRPRTRESFLRPPRGGLWR